MAGSKIPGPDGTDGFAGDRFCLIDDPISPSAPRRTAGDTSSHELSARERELALDIAQITLDIIGIFEPTPFADGTNALISIGRGDWFGAALSGISIHSLRG